MRSLRILTWHVHGSYLYYLTRVPHEWYLPVRPGRPEGYGGRSSGFSWGPNVHDVPADSVRDLQFDAILFQSRRNWETDQYEILSPEQRNLPRLYLEHDPPRENPTDTRHHVDDPNVLLVHVTPFNALMWDSGATPVRVIDHGIEIADGLVATYELARGIAVVNNIARRGRRLGPDIFNRVRAEVPVDLVGLNSADLGGLGDLPLASLPAFESRYRFFFNPIRYTSLGLAVCEAMALGLPIVGLATTEMATAVENGVSGFVDTNPRVIVDRMHDLLRDPDLARRMGAAAQARARERFGMGRFVRDWERALADATGARRVWAGSGARQVPADGDTGNAVGVAGRAADVAEGPMPAFPSNGTGTAAASAAPVAPGAPAHAAAPAPGTPASTAISAAPAASAHPADQAASDTAATGARR